MNNKPKALVDTNILVYSIDPLSPFHLKAKSFLEKITPFSNLVISIQNLMEFYAVSTSRRHISKPFSTKEATQNLRGLAALYPLIFPKKTMFETFLQLVQKMPIIGQEAHDAHLAALMLDNDIGTIYTADTKIFAKLGLKAINPLIKPLTS